MTTQLAFSFSAPEAAPVTGGCSFCEPGRECASCENERYAAQFMAEAAELASEEAADEHEAAEGEGEDHRCEACDRRGCYAC